MKKVFIVLIIATFGMSAKAQLANTNWKGSLAVQGGDLPVILSFKKDTISILNAGNSQAIDIMLYKVTGETIAIKKIVGGSPCAINGEFTVKFAIVEKQLTITPVTDDCEMRKNAWTKDPFIKM